MPSCSQICSSRSPSAAIFLARSGKSGRHLVFISLPRVQAAPAHALAHHIARAAFCATGAVCRASITRSLACRRIYCRPFLTQYRASLSFQ